MISLGTFILTAGLKQQYDAASHYWKGDLSEQDYRDQVAGNLWGVYLSGRSIVTTPRAATSLASRSIPVFATIVTAEGVVAVAQVGSRSLSPALAGAFAGAGTGGLIVLMAAGNIPDGELPKSNAPVNAGTTAIFKNGFYEVNGFKFSKKYYEKLWSTGRKAPSLVVREVLDSAGAGVPDAKKPGFFKYVANGWELVYNPVTKEVWHLQPIKP